MAEYIERTLITTELPFVMKKYGNYFNERQIEKIVEIVYELENSIETADVQPVKRGKMVAMTDEEKYRAYKETARDYDGRCSLCNACVYNTDIFCAECGADMRCDTE